MAAHAMASMACLRGSSQVVFQGSPLSGPTTSRGVAISKLGLDVRAQEVSADETNEISRRAVLGLVASGLVLGSFVKDVFADEPKPIPIGPPPPPSGGLPGTLNSDQARDNSLNYKKDRFYLQPLTPNEAAQRAKESAKDIINIKTLIDKKAWPYVQNDLRLRAEYLRYDLKTVISSKPKEEKKSLQDLTNKLFNDITNLDRAAKIKSTPQAEKYYTETVSTLNDVLAKLG